MIAALCVAVFALVMVTGNAHAAPVGRATADIENVKPGKGETAWGRLVADALRAQSGSDIALVDAGSLNPGTLRAGEIERANIEALLNFGTRDNAVVLTITGAQLRAALEKAVQDYPTRSLSFLHGSGLTVRFGTGAAPRVGDVRISGRPVGNADQIKVAVPSSVANGAVFGGVWNGANNVPLNGTLTETIAAYISAQKTVAPDTQVRIGEG